MSTAGWGMWLSLLCFSSVSRLVPVFLGVFYNRLSAFEDGPATGRMAVLFHDNKSNLPGRRWLDWATVSDPGADKQEFVFFYELLPSEPLTHVSKRLPRATTGIDCRAHRVYRTAPCIGRSVLQHWLHGEKQTFTGRPGPSTTMMTPGCCVSIRPWPLRARARNLLMGAPRLTTCTCVRKQSACCALARHVQDAVKMVFKQREPGRDAQAASPAGHAYQRSQAQCNKKSLM